MKSYWKCIGHQKYHLWHNPFGRFFDLTIEIRIGWEKTSKNRFSLYLGFCGFHLTLFFKRFKK